MAREKTGPRPIKSSLRNYEDTNVTSKDCKTVEQSLVRMLSFNIRVSKTFEKVKHLSYTPTSKLCHPAIRLKVRAYDTCVALYWLILVEPNSVSSTSESDSPSKFD